MLENELKTALTLAQKAKAKILEHYSTDFVAEEKIGADKFREPVTVADRDSSRIIVKGLAEVFPNDGILSEEEPDDPDIRLSKERVWIIDPIDGTTGFVNRDGDFAVQIGLAINGVAMLGIVLLPASDVVMYGIKGGDAHIMIGDDEIKKLTVSDKSDMSTLTLAMSRNHPSKRMGEIIQTLGLTKIERRGSVGLKVGLIAERQCDLYIHPSPRTKLWDTCAPQAILEAAGGRITDLFGNELTYQRRELQNLNGLVATNGRAHSAVIDELRPLLASFGRTYSPLERQ